MPAEDEQAPPRRRRLRLGAAILALLRTRITTGVLTILPILLTLWVVRIIFGWMRDASQWAVAAYLLANVNEDARRPPEFLRTLQFDWDTWRSLDPVTRDDHFLQMLPWYWQWGISFLSVALTIFVLYAIGLFAANLFGRRLIENFERLLERVPMIKTIYRLPKQVISTFSQTQTQNFRKAALIPFPQERMRCVGFITNIFRDSVTDDELCSVFIPTTPNPTTGYLQILRRKDITELDWNVEDAIRTIMSGGILKPEFLTIVPNKDLPEEVRQRVHAGDTLPPPKQVEVEPPDPTV